MAAKVAILTDTGIDGAFAVTLALLDPRLDVAGILATAGNIGYEQATRNVRVILEQVDPPRLPRIGAAPPITYDIDAKRLHGQDGLGGCFFPCAQPHSLPHSEKLLVDLARQHPGELTLICLGPLTVVERAFDLHPDVVHMIKRIICLGGVYHEPGNAGPVSEFHFFCDPQAAQRVLRCGLPVTLIPLDLMRRVLFSPTDLLGLPAETSRACAFLRKIVPHGIAATSNLYGIEGVYLKDVLGVFAASVPDSLTLRPMRVDVEIRGERTRGMAVFDQRSWITGSPNVDVAIDVNCELARRYIKQVLEEQE